MKAHRTFRELAPAARLQAPDGKTGRERRIATGPRQVTLPGFGRMGGQGDAKQRRAARVKPVGVMQRLLDVLSGRRAGEATRGVAGNHALHMREYR